jgi:hypothetical protein
LVHYPYSAPLGTYFVSFPHLSAFDEIHGRYIGTPGHYERLDELPDCSLLPDRKDQIPADCYCDHLTHMQLDDDHISPESTLRYSL